MAGLTEYGKLLRHIRIDVSELLGTMAEKIGVSSAYLSSIENGTRVIPSDLTMKIVEKYNLSDDMKEKLVIAEARTNNSVTIDLQNASQEQIDTAVIFARELKRMSVDDLRLLAKQLKEREGK